MNVQPIFSEFIATDNILEKIDFSKLNSESKKLLSLENRVNYIIDLNSDDEIFKSLEKYINSKLYLISQEIYPINNSKYELTLDRMWINKINSAIIEPHNHLKSLISGALYIESDPDSSCTKFLKPTVFPDHKLYNSSDSDIVEGTTTFSGTTYRYNSNMGDFLFFPGHLMHYVFYNPNAHNVYSRISLSFDSSIKPLI